MSRAAGQTFEAAFAPQFRLRADAVSAVRLVEPIVAQAGGKLAHAGDWLVFDTPDGKVHVYHDAAFRKAFEPVNQPARGEWCKPM